MSIDALILLLSDITNLFLGVGIFLRSPHSRVNRIFALLSCSIITWTTLNYLTDHVTSASLALWLSRFTLIGGLLILISVILLSRYFPRELGLRTFVDRLQLPLMILIIAMTLLPGVVHSVTPTVNGASLHVGNLYWVYVAFLLEGAIVTVKSFLEQYRTNAAKTERSQIRMVLTGLLLYAFFAIISNVVLPIIIDSWKSSRYGPIFSLFIVTLTGYAIVKHRLFDIRPILARSMGYLFSVVVLAAAYGFLVFGFAKLVFGLHVSLAAQIFLSFATAVAGLSFHRFRKTFDKVTNKVFYRDAYEPQTLFDDLNKVLVSTVDLNRLLKQSSTSIAKSLKAEYCAIGLKEGETSNVRVVGTQKLSFNPADVIMARKTTPSFHQSVIATDYLDLSHADFKNMLSKNNIAVLVRLVPNVHRTEEGLGYIILGPKKSGNLYTNQDFRVLDTVANELIIAIQNSLRFEEIENFASTLQGKVNQATRKLRNTNEKLRALDEAKDDFVSMASHQLRTPLTAVKGNISMVLEGDAGKLNDLQQKLLEQAFTSSQRMVYLIADLLNVSRLKTGKFIIEAGPVNLADIVEQEIGQLVETAQSRQLTLSYEKPATFPTLMLDETKTRQVIMNFVDNAIYYTPAGGHITVSLAETPASVELRVKDDGIGVPKSEQHHLFTKFYRAGNARKARPDGTGLGLFMAKKVIVAQGGAIIFETQEGKGSTFGFVFSKTKQAPGVETPKKTSSTAKEPVSA